MEQLYQTAGIYNNISPNQIKELAQDFFDSVNTAAGEEKAKLREFLSFKTADGSTQINNRHLLKDGGSGGSSGYCSIMGETRLFPAIELFVSSAAALNELKLDAKHLKFNKMIQTDETVG